MYYCLREEALKGILWIFTCLLLRSVKGLIPYSLALLAVGGVAIAQQSSFITPTSPLEQPTHPNESPSRLTISVSVADPSDLKVKAGDRIAAGDLIADRGRERQRLEAQARQLDLTLQRLQNATITPPLSPAQVPTIAALPHASYLEEEAAIERVKVSVDQAERTLQQKQQEIEYLRSLPNLNPLVLEHEQAKLTELQQDHTAAVRDYQLAAGRLGKAQGETAYRKYQHTLSIAERVERANQVAMSYQRQWAEYEQRLRDRDYQVAQTQLKLDEVENALANLSVIRSPYAGRIRRIKWLGQGADGLLSAEVTLMVRSGAGTSLPGQLDGVPGDADPTSPEPIVRD